MAADNLDKITSRLRKLIKLEESARTIGNIAEAENAAARIQELLLKYNIDIASISDKDEREKAQEVGMMVVDTEELTRRHESDWIPKLYHALSISYLTKVILTKINIGHEQHDGIYIVGTQLNAELTDSMARKLIVEVRGMVRQYHNDHIAQGGREKINTFRRGFLRGFCNGLRAKLKEQLEEQQAGRRIDHTPDEGAFNTGPVRQSTALVVTNALERIDSFVSETFGRLGQVRSQNLKGTTGFATGQRVGRNHSFNNKLT